MIIHPVPLSGRIEAPPSKSAAHRALIAALLADGESVIANVQYSEDIRSTLGAVRALGAQIRELSIQNGRAVLAVRGGRERPAFASLDCGESGSTLRFMVPVALSLGGRTAFTGRGRLPQRPMDPYFDLFDRSGIRYKRPDRDALPLEAEGPLRPGTYRLPGNVSSQFVTGLMMALPILDGDSFIEVDGPLESGGYVELTRKVLSDFGVRVTDGERPGVYQIPGRQRYVPCRHTVEGDWSQAAFFIAAGALCGDVRVGGLDPSSAQGDRVIAEIIRGMGGDLDVSDGACRARRSDLRGIDVDVSQCPDLAPAVAAALALASGEGRITGAGRLRLKESDRIASIVRTLASLGADIRGEADSILIRGRARLRGGTADSCGDHRIAMMAACAACRCLYPVILEGAGAVGKSYPDFWEDIARLGGKLE